MTKTEEDPLTQTFANPLNNGSSVISRVLRHIIFVHPSFCTVGKYLGDWDYSQSPTFRRIRTGRVTASFCQFWEIYIYISGSLKIEYKVQTDIA